MDYLYRVLGIRVTEQKAAPAPMPNYIEDRYDIQMAALSGHPVCLVCPKRELEPVNVVKKHLARIEQLQGMHAVLVLKRLSYRQKEYLLRDHIPFIVDEKQIYLPFMAVYLQERGCGEPKESAVMLPSAQLLLLFYIYHGCGELTTGEAARKLGLTATSVSRASRQLEAIGLIRTEKRGIQKIIYTGKTPEELFSIAAKHMENPVKKTIYVSKKDVGEELPMSGYTALSEYSLMNSPAVECFAAGSVAQWEKRSSSRLQSTVDQYEVQLWRYDPRKLSAGRLVDPLSLALSLRDDQDERVEEAVEDMLQEVWRDIGGQRD